MTEKEFKELQEFEEFKEQGLFRTQPSLCVRFLVFYSRKFVVVFLCFLRLFAAITYF
jgi:hypothetical protein